MDISGFAIYKRTSSAYKDIYQGLSLIKIVVISTFCLTLSASGSIAGANRWGQRGQPCHVPLYSENEADGVKFLRTEASGLAYKILIH